MISRMLFIALKDFISVISVSERGKSNVIPFDGEVVFRICDDFWDRWKEQTAYVPASSQDDKNGTSVDFCFIFDKDYSFCKDVFLETAEKEKNSIWNVEKIQEVMQGQSILELYQGVTVELQNEYSFYLAGRKDQALEVLSAHTNIADVVYKENQEEKKRLEEQKKIAKQLALEEKKAREAEKAAKEAERLAREAELVAKNSVNYTEGGTSSKISHQVKKKPAKRKKEESPIVKYNKKLREKEELQR